MLATIDMNFWDKVLVGDDCWEWDAGRHSVTGYGKYGTNSKWLAHRSAYVQWHGAIPEGREVDHVCRNVGCVRPDHLRAVTHKENQAVLKVDVCAHGHDMTDPTNVYESPPGSRRPYRACRGCRRQWKRDRRV